MKPGNAAALTMLFVMTAIVIILPILSHLGFKFGLP